MTTPEDAERRTTLTSAVKRYEALRQRDSLADPEAPDGPTPLSRAEALELLALGEVIVRKAGYGRQLAVRTARENGASWAEIGRSLGQSRQSAWEAHTRWIENLALDHEVTGLEGLDATEAARARELARSWDD
jgi:hypothetical protein